MFVRNASTPCCYYLEIISIFAWSSLQYFVTCKAFSLEQYFRRLKSQLFFSYLMTICLFVSHGFLLNLGITKKLFFKMWASISCLLGNCCFFADNFCTPIFILCGFICCDYYYIWGDLWCQFQILYRNATAFPNYIFLIWCTSKLSLCHVDKI